ncbi:DUF427 domain-containing protein [Ferrovibrio sp.]|uniref:DUF427 domain-containing protein n=1 Tax=Ferrovibrio sp. TaxID=1917215 RepID=UPI00311D8FE7
MKLPGRDHPIAIAPAAGRVRVHFNGRIVADSRQALVLREASYPPVFYIPRGDADMSVCEPSTHGSHCPYKGDAGYFSLAVDGRRAENAVWTYDAPYPAVAAIAGHLAFYPDRVDAIEQLDG